MKDDDLDKKTHDLLFGVRRSIRYHHRRERFFDSVNKIATVLSALSGTATLAAVLAKAGPGTTLTFAACVTLFSVIDLVIGTAQKARNHNDFSRRYFVLEKEIIKQEHITDEALSEFIAIRLDIESDEPPPYKVLDAICHNETVRAGGYDQIYSVEISWYQRLFAQFFDFREHTIKQRQCDQE